MKYLWKNHQGGKFSGNFKPHFYQESSHILHFVTFGSIPDQKIITQRPKSKGECLNPF